MNGKPCPKCGKIQIESEECIHCGIIISKYTASLKPEKTDTGYYPSEASRSGSARIKQGNTKDYSLISKKISFRPSGIFIVVLAMLCFFTMYRDKEKIEISAETKKVTLSDAYEASKSFAMEEIEDSEIIKFQDYNADSSIHYDNEATVSEVQKGAFQINACMEAKDSSGVIRNLKYSCIIEYAGRDRWKLVNIDLSKCE